MKRNRSQKATERARGARRNPSAAEAAIWKMLRGRELGFKFRRECPIGPCRLDFYCAEAKLALEMDGEQHDSERDQARDDWLGNLGIATLRIPNRQFFLLGDAEYRDFVSEIVRACQARISSSGTLPDSPRPQERPPRRNRDALD